MLIRLDYPPSVNRIWRNNGRGKVYKPGPVVAWANKAAWQVKALMGARKPLEGPVALKVIAHRPDKRNRDADNLIKLLQDALQEGGLVANDCQFRTAIRWADDPWEWRLGGIGYVAFPHMVTVELGEPQVTVKAAKTTLAPSHKVTQERRAAGVLEAPSTALTSGPEREVNSMAQGHLSNESQCVHPACGGAA